MADWVFIAAGGGALVMGGVYLLTVRARSKTLLHKLGPLGGPSVSMSQSVAEIARVATGDALRRFKKAAKQTERKIIAYISPYCLGHFGDGLPLNSQARLDANAEGTGSATDYTMGMAALLAVFGREGAEAAADIKNESAKATMFSAGAGTKAGKAEAKLLEKIADTREYDGGKIQADMAELAARFPDKVGMPVKPADDGMPMQTIRNESGEVLMKGRAMSVEHLIAIKIDEAAKSPDPNKRIINLAGAQLDEKTLGRKAEFDKFNFQNMNMRGANLAGANFKECQFKNVDMEGANLKKATIDMCHFENVNLSKFEGDKDTKIKNSTLKNVDMSEANAPEMKFEHIRAEHLNISGANFSGSSWTDVKVENLWAKDAILNGVKWGKVDISGRQTSMENVQMNNAVVANSSFGTPEYGINMRGLKANNSTWTDVQFNKSDLSQASFEKANFTRVDMRQVVTPAGPINVSGANITGLQVGAQAKVIAVDAVHSGVTLHPTQDFVFSGTAPLARAADEAIKAGSQVAEIIHIDGATRQAEAAGLIRQQMARKPNPMMDMKPKPKNPWDKY